MSRSIIVLCVTMLFYTVNLLFFNVKMLSFVMLCHFVTIYRRLICYNITQ